MASYELWQLQTRNLIGAFATSAEALALARRAADTHGDAYIQTVLLGREDDEGHSTVLAQGEELLELARQDVSRAPTSSS